MTGRLVDDDWWLCAIGSFLRRMSDTGCERVILTDMVSLLIMNRVGTMFIGPLQEALSILAVWKYVRADVKM